MIRVLLVPESILRAEGDAMKAQGTVKGILVAGNDGQKYLLGFEPTRPVPTPVLSRRGADRRFEPGGGPQEARPVPARGRGGRGAAGRFEPVADLKEASRVAARQLGLGPQLIGPGMGPHI